MNSVTETIAVTLFQSIDGLCVEVEGLPVQSGPEYIAKSRSRELAEIVIRERYPELLIHTAEAIGDTGYLFRVEPI